MPLVKKILFWVGGILGISIILVWLLLSSAIFSGARTSLAERVLTNALGQDVVINGDVRFEPGTNVHIVAEGLSLQSPSMPEVVLAQIGSVEFDLPFTDVVSGNASISGLHADGIQLNLIVDKDGTVSWRLSPPGKDADQSAPDTPKAKKSGRNPLDVLAGRHAKFSNTRVVYQSALNGFDLDWQMTELDVASAGDSDPLEIKGDGTLNGEALTLDASFAGGGAFSADASFEKIKATFEGTPTSEEEPDGYSVDVALEISELGQLLDVFKLEKSVDGTGHVSAVFKSSEGVNRIDDLDLLVSFDTGLSILVAGDMGKLGDPTDMSVRTLIRLFPEDAEPAPTTNRKDLKLIAVDMEIASEPGKIPQRKMVIETNGFTLDTAGEGPPPITVSQVSRTQDGKLRLGKVDLRLGPPGQPFITLDGAVEDALRLDGIAAVGTLDIPAASLISPEFFQDSEFLGKFAGQFDLAGNAQSLALSGLEAETKESDLWDLKVAGSIENVLKFQDVALNIAVDVPSSATLLEALTLEPVEAGPATLRLDLKSNATEWDADAALKVQESNLKLSLDLDDATTDPVLRGLVESDLIRVEDLRHIIGAAIELGRLNQLGKDEETTEDEADAEAVEEDAGTEETAAETEEDPPGPFRNVTLLPIGQAILASGLDLDVDLDLRKIEGPKGTSSLQTEVVMTGEKLTAGPLKFEYGGGHFDVNGEIDLTQEVRSLELVGSAGGWSLKEILDLLKFKKGAGGTLYTNFDVTGPVTSAKDFIAALTGSATISMRGGFIESQLLDVAGLGVLPWLFSKDKKKQAEITCIRMPLYVSNGNISTKQSVLETEQVQIVVFGNVNLKRKTMDINGQPRKIGEPLSRSPWPFTAKGSMAKPKIKVKDGPRRMKRSDGADMMPAQRKPCVPDILQLQ